MEQLRKALADRDNYAVSKAALLARDMRLAALVPELLAAFDRFLVNAAKTDPQCWAKNAIAAALKDLGHDDAAVFLSGLAHVQPEPVWGGHEDTAAALRATCALALPGCRADDLEILAALTGALVDPARPVRIDAARAIAQMGRPEGALLLRLKALTGDVEPEVTGWCLVSLLSLAPRDSVPFAARFLDSADEEVRWEAAVALAGSREPEAIAALKRYWCALNDERGRGDLLRLFGASPAPEAAEFLLDVIGGPSEELAAHAVAALAASRFREQWRERAAAATAGRDRPARAFAQHFGERSVNPV